MRTLILLLIGLKMASVDLSASETRTEVAPGLVKAVTTSEGVVTPAVREAFLKESEKRVVAELATVGVRLTEAQLDCARKDPEARAACFGTIWPPDPRILLNLLEVREQVGPDLYAKYRNLLLAGAVARRLVGVGEGALGEKEEWALRSRAESEAKGGPRHWPDYDLFDITPAGTGTKVSDKKKEPRAAAQRKRQERAQERQSKEADAEGLRLAANFLKSKNLKPVDVMASADLRRQVLQSMGDHAPKAGVLTDNLMMDVMVAAGMRPAERDPFPSLADYCRYVSQIDARFPVREAPWPLLMPLAKGWPIREAEDIQKRVAKGGKLPTYGKYQGKEPMMQARLQPSQWSWNSWQGTYQAGGVCHEMSTIGVGTYLAVGVPATKTGQPHHSCVTIFEHSPKGYSVQIKQGTHGPIDTHTQWLFADDKAERPLVYHMGLALSMNVGLQDYVDSRIGLHLANMVQASGDTALADRTLAAAAARNPYNTEIWDALRDIKPTSENLMVRRTRILRLLCELGKGEDSAVATFRNRPTEVSLEAQPDEPELDNPASWTATYVSVVAREFLLDGIEPGADIANNRKALENLRACVGKGAPDVNSLVAKFDIALNGWQTVREPVLAAAKRYIDSPTPALADSTLDKIRPAVAQCKDSAALIAWLTELEKICDDRMTSKNRPKSKNTYGDPLYREINELLAVQLDKSGRKPEAAALRAKLNQAVDGK